MHKQSCKSLKPVLGQLEIAAEIFLGLRWAIERANERAHVDGFSAIARTVLPTAQAALEAISGPSPISDQILVATDAVAGIQWVVDSTVARADLDGLISLVDPAIERAEDAIADAQALLRKKARRVSQ